MSYGYGSHAPWAGYGMPNYGPPPSNDSYYSGPSGSTLGGWANRARQAVGSALQGAASFVQPTSQPTTPPPGSVPYYSASSASSGGYPPPPAAYPNTSASSGSFKPTSNSSSNPPTYAQATQSNPPSPSPTQTNPQTPVSQSAYPASTNGNQTVDGSKFFQCTLEENGDTKKWNMNVTGAGMERGKLHTCTLRNPKTNEAMYTLEASIDDQGVMHANAYQGRGPPRTSTDAAGSTNANTGPNGQSTNTNNSVTPLSRPDTMINYYDLLQDRDPQNMVFKNWTDEELENITGDPIMVSDNTSYANHLFGKGGLYAFNGTRQELEDMTNLVQNRYRQQHWEKDRPNGIGSIVLNRKQAREAALRYLTSNETLQEKWTEMDRWAAKSTGIELMTENHFVPTSENGLASTSNLAFDGSTVADWVLKMVGPGDPVTGYSSQQVEKMKRFMDASQAYGDQVCEMSGFTPVETSLFSSQIGTWGTFQLFKQGKFKGDTKWKDDLVSSARKAANVVRKWSPDEKETYVKLATGRLNVNALNAAIADAESQQNNNNNDNTNSQVNSVNNGTNSNLNSSNPYPSSNFSSNNSNSTFNSQTSNGSQGTSQMYPDSNKLRQPNRKGKMVDFAEGNNRTRLFRQGDIVSDPDSQTA